MTFKNHAVQHRELQTEETQCSPISFTRSSGRRISRIKDDNKRSSVGLVTIDNQGKIGSLNPRFISMWNLTEFIIRSLCWQQVLRFIIEQLENPQSFLIDIRSIKEQKTLEIQGIAQLKDGKSFSYSIEPEWLEERVVGRVYRFSSLL